MTTMAAEPRGVWDPNDRDGVFRQHRDECAQWAAAHLPGRGHYTLRAEFYLIDAPFAVVYDIGRDSEGRKLYDKAAGEPLLLPPATVMLSELPPAHLLRSDG